MSATGFGFGKIIIFNEHFVVYGSPAIASPIEQGCFVTLSTTNENNNPNNDVWQIQKSVIQKYLQILNINAKNELNVSVQTSLIPAAGMGASAAFCVASARAISNFFSLNLTDEQINDLSFEGEKIFHGNPSGIDNTVSTFGKPIWFEKKENILTENLKIKNALHIVIGFSGESGNTKDAVAKVATWKNSNLRKFNFLLERSKNLILRGREALADDDLEKVGRLMNENHKLLVEIGVSTPKLEKLIAIAKDSGALGAKITGSGCGGCIVALASNEGDQDKIDQSFLSFGFKSIKTKIRENL
ncbi:TPA: mevalonate kinase [Candidatus Dependentiae bacterium]|nr:MAG: Mevalonate kinase [candidate division TM6 bacterium GW2011_GWE2_31_21]KKP53756.1 MAG: Mevalonate kinase [candidate division TM6 bacterium GW2011_GWF2_33_332]HBS48490.1 mevalonate kinase [Candidatus Dependentiae bacterium]HBZ73105.1 mevalonate kinase [Candidatus Dependentiae bacterium]